ncbi:MULTISPECIES: GNAT family N-acetyltransferase [unclassified Fusibacter]|uniref:GNAT family N-acetyltransferase n=1 Tax=unclassified Fusibacter TaxID=2624464 RepID=UPI001013A952|nr:MULTISPECIES: GNAT family N-acetyltransferase [unclassified Fusibacter]MCK8061646.1 GNAT family N-acetyltransferase [Fusibacter sp. A2]NPE23830.1 GNAT family N-acetyltransferase [Fusibacter sp. A1]RXV58603.1 N-acetyltransferase [Fusibacter sp. A1]
MIRKHTMASQVSDILVDLVPLSEGFELVQYDPMIHHEIVPQIYSRCFNLRAWGELWDKFEGFYSEGVFLIYHKSLKSYVGFIVSYIAEDTPYITSLGVTEDFRGRRLGTYLVQRVAQHYAKMGYKQLWVDINPHYEGFERRCVSMGFSVIREEIR